MNLHLIQTLLLAAVLTAATSCARVDRSSGAPTPAAIATPPAPPVTEPRRQSSSGALSPGDADYLEYYRSTSHIEADAMPDPATLAPDWRKAHEVAPDQSARLEKYRSTCNIR